MKCKDCKDNYLLKLFNQCMNRHEIYNDALEEFTSICDRSKDPRSSVMVLYNIMKNDCETCRRYRNLYESYFKKEDKDE